MLLDSNTEEQRLFYIYIYLNVSVSKLAHMPKDSLNLYCKKYFPISYDISNNHFHSAALYVSNLIEGGDIWLFITLVTKAKYFLIRWLINLGDLNWILIGWFIQLSVLTFQPLIVIYIWGNFVYYHLEGTLFYWPSSHPFRFLIKSRYVFEILF